MLWRGYLHGTLTLRLLRESADDGDRAQIEEALEHLEEQLPPTEAMSPEAEAVIFALSEGSYGKYQYIPDLVDHWVRTGGLSHAVLCAVSATEVALSERHETVEDQMETTAKLHPRKDLPDSYRVEKGRSAPWDRLREHLAAADEEAWEEARWWAEESRRHESLSVRAGVAFAFPEEPWADELLRSGDVEDLDGIFLLSQAASDVEIVRESLEGHDLTPKSLSYRRRFLNPEYLVNVVDAVGPEILPIFRSWFCEYPLKAQQQRDVADVFAHADDPAALEELFLNAGRKAASAAARAAVRRFPESALPLLVELLGRSDLSEDQKETLRRLLEDSVEKKAIAKIVDERFPEVRALLGGKTEAEAEGMDEPADEDLGGEPIPIDELPPLLREAFPERMLKKLRRRRFWRPRRFTRLRLADGRPLPISVIETLGVLWMEGRGEEIRSGRDLFDPASAADFVWDLFSAWLKENAPSAEKWAFLALVDLGDDNTVRRLEPHLREWPDQGQHPRAKLGLEVLERFDSDVALMTLDRFTRRIPYRGLRLRAEEIMGEIARRRGLSQDELADRLVPDFGLDRQGSLTLDYGPRQFRVGFDETLKPFVLDVDGARLRALPRKRKTDDAAMAKQASETWKGLQKDVRKVARREISRLERAMCSMRRLDVDTFRAFFVEHPLKFHLTRRLLWAAYGVDDDEPLGVFRVAEDRAYADEEDQIWEMPGEMSDQAVRIGVPHPATLGRELCAKFDEILKDYEILQPFPQLSRDVYFRDGEEGEATSLNFPGEAEVSVGRIYRLLARGWRRGAPQDYGDALWIQRRSIDGKSFVVLPLDPGLPPGESDYGEVLQLGPAVCRRDPSLDFDPELSFGVLDPITFSEVVRDLKRLGPRDD